MYRVIILPFESLISSYFYGQNSINTQLFLLYLRIVRIIYFIVKNFFIASNVCLNASLIKIRCLYMFLPIQISLNDTNGISSIN